MSKVNLPAAVDETSEVEDDDESSSDDSQSVTQHRYPPVYSPYQYPGSPPLGYGYQQPPGGPPQGYGYQHPGSPPKPNAYGYKSSPSDPQSLSKSTKSAKSDSRDPVAAEASDPEPVDMLLLTMKSWSDFNGRSRRAEWLYFMGLTVAIAVVIEVLDRFAPRWIFAPFSLLGDLVAIIPRILVMYVLRILGVGVVPLMVIGKLSALYYLGWRLCGAIGFGMIVLAALIFDQSGAIAIDGSAYHMLLSIIPLMSLSVRRLHDIGYSGRWLCLCALVAPIPFVLFFLATVDGPQTYNAFGPSPKGLGERGPKPVKRRRRRKRTTVVVLCS